MLCFISSLTSQGHRGQTTSQHWTLDQHRGHPPTTYKHILPASDWEIATWGLSAPETHTQHFFGNFLFFYETSSPKSASENILGEKKAMLLLFLPHFYVPRGSKSQWMHQIWIKRARPLLYTNEERQTWCPISQNARRLYLNALHSFLYRQ